MPISAQAQDEFDSLGVPVKHVEVSKEYAPSLGYAEKLSIPYDGGDTTMMRPEIDYTVTPSAESTRFVTRPLAPSTLTYWDFDRPLPFYAKVGGGYPWRSTADLYASTQHPDIGYALGYLNHDGLYQRHASMNRSGTWLDNRVGGAVGKYLGRRLLEGKIDYHHLHSGAETIFPYEDESGRHFRGGMDAGYAPVSENLYGEVRFGDSFTDLSRFNFAFDAGAGHFWPHESGYPDYGDFIKYRIGGRAGRQFGKHVAMLDAGFDASIDREWFYRTWTLGGHYDYRSKKVDMRFGLTYHFDDISGQKNAHYILPNAWFRFDVQNGAFVPFLELKSELFRNDPHRLRLSNLYYLPSDYQNVPSKSTVHYTIEGGVSGRLLHNMMSYHLSIGYAIIENYNFWYSWEDGGLRHFDLDQGGLNSLSLNGGLDVRPISDLTVSLRLKLGSHTDHVEVATLLPEFEGRVGVQYRHRKFLLGAHIDMISARDMSLFRGDSREGDITLPFSADMGLEFDWYALDWMTIYAQGYNLFNGPLYDWSRPLPMFGPGFEIGVKVRF